MIVRLFDIENSNLVITEHCHALPFLKKIMEEYDFYIKLQLIC